MANSQKLDEVTKNAIKSSIDTYGLHGAARRLSLNRQTLANVNRRGSASPEVLAKLRGKVTRAEDYIAIAEIRQPRKQQPQFSWSLEAIRSARDAQAKGKFKQAAQLAKAFAFDDAIFVAKNNRVRPLTALSTRLSPVSGTRGEAVAKRAEASCTVKRSTLSGIGSTLSIHSVAFGYVRQQPSEDGTRVDFALEEWPIESVEWVEEENAFVTRTDDGQKVTIVHGDGRWVIFRVRDLQPWLDAALLALALVFATHLDGIKDWASGSRSHGQARIVGELPQGVALRADDSQTLSPEAQTFLDMLADIVSGDAGAGIIPSGAKANFITNTSTAWQVFSELVNDRARAAARILLGNDGQLGSNSSAPGVDVATLFGVATTMVQTDVTTIELGLYEGVYVPWTAINVGDSKLAPRYTFELPNEDEAKKSKQRKDSLDALMSTIERYKSNGIQVDQSVVDTLAALHGVEPVPQLAPVADRSVPLVLAPTDVAKVVRSREARAAQGLEPFGDERDDLTIAQLDGWVKSPTGAPSNAAAPVAAVESPSLQ